MAINNPFSSFRIRSAERGEISSDCSCWGYLNCWLTRASSVTGNSHVCNWEFKRFLIDAGCESGTFMRPNLHLSATVFFPFFTARTALWSVTRWQWGLCSWSTWIWPGCFWKPRTRKSWMYSKTSELISAGWLLISFSVSPVNHDSFSSLFKFRAGFY